MEIIISIILCVLWLVVLTFFVFRMTGHYNRLTEGISKHSLKDILEHLLERQKHTSSHVENLERAIKQLAQDGEFHIQRVGLVRFNPFSDTGGSQSFTLAILDGHNNGLVMTSLYARTGNRWYIKEVRGGKGKQLELSKEETAAITRAQTLERR